MTVTFDPSRDFEQVVDGLEPVTVRAATNPNPELVVNGTFDADLAGWTVFAGVVPTCDAAALCLPDGASIFQAVNLAVGGNYHLKLTALLGAFAATLRIKVGTPAGGGQMLDATVGSSLVYEAALVATAPTAYLYFEAVGGDWRVDDVSLKLVTGAGVSLVPKALRRAVTVKEITQSDGKVIAADTAWHIPITGLAAPPEVGATIIDQTGRQWKVIQSHWHLLHKRWRLISRSLGVLASGSGGSDGTLFDFYRLYPMKEADHSEKYKPVLVAAQVRAQVNVDSVDAQTQHGQRALVKRATITTEVPLPIVPNFPSLRVTIDGLDYFYVRTDVERSLTEFPRYQFEAAPWRLR